MTATFSQGSVPGAALTASDAGWDVACGETGVRSAVAVAEQGGRVHFLVTDLGSVRLFSCTLPPL